MCAYLPFCECVRECVSVPVHAHVRLLAHFYQHTHTYAHTHTHRVNLGISGFLMIRKEASGEPFKAAIALPGNTTSNKARIDAHAYTHTHMYIDAYLHTGKATRGVYPTPLDSEISVDTMASAAYAATTLEGGLPEDAVLEEVMHPCL